MCGIKIDLVLVWVSKLTCFLCGGRIDLILFVGKNYLILLYGAKLPWFLCGWSKLTWFLDAGRKSLRFSVSIEGLDYVWVIVIDLISV